MGFVGRLGGMLSAPRRTLRALATSGAGDLLEPLCLWAAVVLALHGREVYRLLALAGEAPTIVLNRLVDLLWRSGRNDLVLLAVVAALLALFGRRVAPRRISARAGVVAAAFLLVPAVALKALGGILSLGGLDLWWMPHHAVDSFAVVVDNRVDWGRFALKCAVAYGPSAVLLLDLVRFLCVRAPLADVAPAPPPFRVRLGGGALATLVVVLAAGAIADVVGKREAIRPALPGAPMPDVTLAWLQARPGDPKGRASLSSMRGKVVLLDFWASWCPPCRKAMPELSKLHDELGPRGFMVVGVNREPYDLRAAKRAVEQLAPSFPSLVDDRGYGERLGLTSLPTSYLIDRQGVLRALHLGYTDPAVVRAEVERLLDEEEGG